MMQTNGIALGRPAIANATRMAGFETALEEYEKEALTARTG